MDFPTHKELEKRIARRIRYTVDYAYKNSPFYRELFDAHGIKPGDITSAHDLERVPIVTKRDVQNNQPPKTRSYRFKCGKGAIIFNTSGSTGLPATFFKSKEDRVHLAENAYRAYTMMGMRQGSTIVNYFPVAGMNCSFHLCEDGINAVNGESVPISNTPFPPEAEYGIIRAHQSNFIVALASHADRKARLLEQAGLDPKTFNITSIGVAGEPSSQTKRAHIAKAYNTEVFDFYASTEASCSACECGEHNGMHFFNDRMFFMVVDETTGKRVNDGEVGKLVITQLIDEGEETAMSLINYDTSDFTHVIPGTCPCGIAFPRIANPNRVQNGFVFGAVNITNDYFENMIYNEENLNMLTGEYRIELSFDETERQDILSLFLEARDLERVPKEFGVDLLKGIFEKNQQLRDTVYNAQAGRIEVHVTGEFPPVRGKPKRVIDKRIHD